MIASLALVQGNDGETPLVYRGKEPSQQQIDATRDSFTAALRAVRKSDDSAETAAQTIIEALNGDPRLLKRVEGQLMSDLARDINRLPEESRLAIASSDYVKAQVGKLQPQVRAPLEKSIDFIEADSGSVDQKKAFAAVVQDYVEVGKGNDVSVGNPMLEAQTNPAANIVYRTMMLNEDFRTNLVDTSREIRNAANNGDAPVESFLFKARQGM